MLMNKKPIIIVAGEPYSIFSEIFFKSLKKIFLKRPLILIASKQLFTKQMKKLGYKFKFNKIDKKLSNKILIKKRTINIIDVDFNFEKTFDKISDKSNEYISECFSLANKLLKNKKAYALINGPISKKNFLKTKFLGVTEYLAKMNKTKNYAMLIYNKNLSVSPLTTHIAVKKILKIAITGLNPHCESNYKDSEEKKIIYPTIKRLNKKSFKIEGPLPADSLFMKNNIKKFDVVIGMYHDQVLTPIKTIYNFDAINITLGLPFIRISPDHGTNNKMLGKNKSDASSLISAIKFLNN